MNFMEVVRAEYRLLTCHFFKKVQSHLFPLSTGHIDEHTVKLGPAHSFPQNINIKLSAAGHLLHFIWIEFFGFLCLTKFPVQARRRFFLRAVLFIFQAKNKAVKDYVDHPGRSKLRIEIETTSIPEAKGRVERLNQTLQSLLPIVFRREGITDIDSANEYLSSHLDELFNDKFSMPVNHTRSVFEKQIGGKEIDEATVNLICSILCSRVLIGQCIRFNKKMYKLFDENGVQQNYADHTKVTVINTFDNQLYTSVNDARILKLEELPVHAEKSKSFDADYAAPKPHKVYIPPMNHPWRYSEFEKHARSQRHRIELELQKEDMFLDHLQENVSAGYMVMGHRVA